MRFPGFFGNEGLKRRLSAAHSGGGLSHCYILSGPKGSGKHTLAMILAAAMECTGKGEQPCGVCPSCHKIFGGGHPDVITVDSDKATVPIRVIRDMQADAYIRPNEGKKKVYIIPRAQDMQAPAQNALLKLLEEPPAYCTFLLLTDNAEKILSTVRSRAVELSLLPLSDEHLKTALTQAAPGTDAASLAAAAEKSNGYLGAALTLLRSPDSDLDARCHSLAQALCAGDELSLLEAIVPLEKLKRPELLLLLGQFKLLLIKALGKKSGSNMLASSDAALLSRSCSPQRLFETVQAVDHALEMLNTNGSAGHCVEYLLGVL